MKWPWLNRDVPAKDVGDTLGEARAANRKETKELHVTRMQGHEIRRVTRSLAEMREYNHIAEALRKAMGEKT